MVQSLLNLHMNLNNLGSGLTLLRGDPVKALEQLISEQEIDTVYINLDYTPFSRKRDEKINQLCKRLHVRIHWFDDALLHAPGSIMTAGGTPYRVFAPFYKTAKTIPIPEPKKLPADPPLSPMAQTRSQEVQSTLSSIFTVPDATGDTPSIQKAFQKIEAMANYQAERDIPSLNATSRLSAHLKFGTISVRQAYYGIIQSLGPEHPLLRQLYWRDFFTHVAWFYPHVFGHAFDHRLDHIEWNRDESLFKAWCEGKTGFPIVDAGMRELQESGFMHNRVRMITASFLVKDLHLPWRWGESWFARHLVDYDPAVNNGNWQWAASTGCDAQPWFRIFNPWRQQERFDPECKYIKSWLPALKDIDCKIIHNWARSGDSNLHPLPLIDHGLAAEQAKKMFREAIENSRQ